jgi:uncharacterized membrane protein YeaQ/YmgE (transglycosylase-associated protein family)/predicted nucleotidyltransferase
MWKFICCLLLFSLSFALYGQSFTEVSTTLPGVDNSSVAWGDYDNDGDLDLILTGYTPYITPSWISRIYRNDSGVFTNINAAITGVVNSTVSWGDFDNDSDLDLLITGWTAAAVRISKIYMNDSGVFIDLNASLTGIDFGSTSWGDYDNDGDQDILITGNTGTASISKIYRNDSGVYTDINAGLQGVKYSSSSWADFDNDGDLDILLSGNTGSTKISKIYRNNSGVFSDINAGLTGVDYSSVAWGDYDNDGDQDILLTGNTGTEYISRIYRNDSGTFTDINAGITGVYWGSVSWGDCDNDGDLDMLMTGQASTGRISRIYRNDTETFTDISAGLLGVNESSVAFGDFDKDNDLDILLTGFYGTGNYVCKLYRNNITVQNSEPGAPTNLTSIVEGNDVVLSWDKATDNQTAQNGLSYNIYIGTTSQSVDKKAPMSDISTGYRKVVACGNINQTNTWNIKNLSSGTFYWSVQAVDHSFKGSVFAQEQNFTPEPPSVPEAISATNISYTGFTANWKLTSGAVGYFVDIATDVDFTNYLSDYQNKDVFNVTSIQIAGLSVGTTYYYRIRAYNQVGISGNSNVVSVDTPMLDIPSVPEAISATNISYTGFTANWNLTSGAIGYSLDIATDVDFTNYLSDYQNKDVFDVTSYQITGLVVGATFYYRVRAYNQAGTSGSSNIITGVLLFTEFTEISTSLIGVYRGSGAWGDYDNDGDLDILMNGITNSGSCYSLIYHNDNGEFTDWSFPYIGSAYDGSLEWGDYDNDGDLDVLSTGIDSSDVSENISGKINKIGAGLVNVHNGDASWGDYDNDGDLDIFLTGDTDNGYVSMIYCNSNGFFTDINAGLIGVKESSADWGDYDNDGDPDILLTGDSGSGIISKIYRNDNSVFTDINAGLIGVKESSADWGDYDNDGDLDIIITGHTGAARISKIYRNDNGVFTDINAGLIGVNLSSVVWGDYDNDGDLDVLITGFPGSSNYVSKIYKNEGNGIFTDISVQLKGVCYSSVAWGDYDNDGDLDILLTGLDIDNKRNAKIYRNNLLVKNTKPSAPSNLTSILDVNEIILNWDKSMDSETPQNGLSYNLYIGTTSQTGNMKDPMSEIATGYRKVVSLGNGNQSNSWTVKNLPSGTYYWGVQAIDHAFSGSEFSDEQFFFVGDPNIPRNIQIVYSGGVTTITWNEVEGATSYKVYSSQDPYGTFTDVSSLGIFDGTSWAQSSGIENKLFYYVVSVTE